ncbi:Oxidoreductase YdhF [Lactobacillus helveticus]|nr:Oxidoreductase YdhF [Lactobacillus helveticus]NRO67480.1 Oxidoreductase YdhF [Lactobacillus helveticus]NRO69430.1 Oxidoreductase YdhF [Lactobacillus helveticus]
MNLLRNIILNSVDGILKRMDIDYLDSLLLHRPDMLMDLEGVKEAFDILQAEGKVRFFGVSNFNSEQFLMLQDAVSQPLMFNQLQFGLMHTGMVDSDFNVNLSNTVAANHSLGLLDFLRRKHITLQAWSPFQYGEFEGSFINNPKFPELNDKLDQLAKKYNVGKNAIAAAWILRWHGQAQVIIGTMTPAHIADSAKAGSMELTRKEWYDLYLAAGHDLP